MNPGSQDNNMYYQNHIPGGQPPQQQSVSSPYPHQQHQHSHAQPPLLQPGPGQYQPHYGNQYSAYSHPMGQAGGPPAVSSAMGGPTPTLPLPGVNQAGIGPSGYTSSFDTTGQLAPQGMKPRVTATLWEDEGSLCFQVEARGICVARREDNHMINGTKLLNVAGMTRGRRDGILKSEKLRHVVKIGPMHLKGVWIPFERALDFANKEKITELLYPLFVHNIGSLLCHPTNQSRANQVMAAAQRKHESLRSHQPPGLPALQQHHHALALPGPQPQLHPPPMGRPPMERSHSLIPSPPASATVMNDMNGPNGFQWSQQGMTNGQGSNGITIDTSLTNNGRSMPNTPATTPPGAAIQPMSYPQVSQSYDNSRQMYQTSAPQPSAYPPPHTAAQERPMYAHSNSYVKSEMAPPSNRSGVPNGEVDVKPTNGILHAGQGETTNGVEDEAEHEHDGEYTHDSGAYDATRGPYNYSAPPVSSLQNDHSHLSPELTGSPHQVGSGRATPRTAAAPSSYYSGQGYNTTPPRVGQTSSNLYNVMSHERGSTNGSTTNDVYGAQGDLGAPLQNGYPSSGQLNGVPSNGVPSMKRGRDDDDDRSDLKRRKGVSDGSMPSPTYSNQMPQPTMPQPSAAVPPQRRR